MKVQNKKVFVAMSGGVDSSVAAVLLKQQGYDVVGVTMCFSVTDVSTRRPSCCGLEGIEDAKTAARILGIPHYVLDFKKELKDLVIDNFIQEYLNGRTPNPCVRCNQFLKFQTLLNKVTALGADWLATGHYARLEFNENRRQYVLKKAVDAKKDQSYFLYGLKEKDLPRVLFPLGGLTKEEVRDLAEKAGLNTASKAESQDICFIPDSGYKQFIKDHIGEQSFTPGPFMNHKGEEVGQHKGVANYTIGQRDKLGIALGVPVYVFKIDKAENIVYVGPKENLLADGLEASSMNWIAANSVKEDMAVQVRIRYNAPDVSARIKTRNKDKIKVVFDEPQSSVTPGQSVVIYERDIVLGGGIIEKVIKL